MVQHRLATPWQNRHKHRTRINLRSGASLLFRSVWSLEVEPRCVFLEKISLEHIAYLQQQFRVDSGAMKDFVDVGAVAIQLS